MRFSAILWPEFTKRQLLANVARHLEKSGVIAKDSTIEQNVDVCLRSYIPTNRKNKGMIAEETFDSPLADLDLIRSIPEDGVNRFNIGPKATIGPAIFAYAVLSYAPELIHQRRTLNVEDCIHRPGSPGQIFADENSVIERLETMEEMTGGMLRLQETAGIRQIYFSGLANDDFMPLAYRLLDQYYARHDI